MKLEEFVKVAQSKHDGPNLELFKATARRLRNIKHEEHYKQRSWATETACGTACCIAGWALIAAGLKPTQVLSINNTFDFPVSVRRAALNLLGLTDGQAMKLFNGKGLLWPRPYADRFYASQNGETSERPSQVAADLLDAIADGKVKL